jgi:hypothetical protein
MPEEPANVKIAKSRRCTLLVYEDLKGNALGLQARDEEIGCLARRRARYANPSVGWSLGASDLISTGGTRAHGRVLVDT